MIFPYGLEPVLIQWILIGFIAILEIDLNLLLGKVQCTKARVYSNSYPSFTTFNLISPSYNSKRNKDGNIHKSEATKSRGWTNDQ